MSQQINLYDPALLQKREWLTAANLAAVTLALLVTMGGWGAWARTRLGALETESLALAPQAKALQDQMVAVGRQLAEVKPDPGLAADLSVARAMLAMRGEVIAALKKGLGADSPGFAEYLRGLARQSPSGLWLTGFTIGEGGATMEVRGRMTDPALLPEYIRRLDSEKAFQGRAFAALKVVAVQPAAAAANAPGAAAPAIPAVPLYHEFTLAPLLEGMPETGRASADAAHRATEGKR